MMALVGKRSHTVPGIIPLWSFVSQAARLMISSCIQICASYSPCEHSSNQQVVFPCVMSDAEVDIVTSECETSTRL